MAGVREVAGFHQEVWETRVPQSRKGESKDKHGAGHVGEVGDGVRGTSFGRLRRVGMARETLGRWAGPGGGEGGVAC